MASAEQINEGRPGIMRGTSASEARGHQIPQILPHEKVFPIQIGTELYKLSGASISSDDLPTSPGSECSRDTSYHFLVGSAAKKPRAPSYFSAFFKCQLEQAEQKRLAGEESTGVRILYIDRDPVTFADISRHLQGYHIAPRDGSHFVKLFADAQFYQLPRLIDQLYEEAIYISIGGREFRITRDIFTNPGDSPNYFTLGYGFLFSNPSEAFPGLKRDGLLRPPSIMPPAIPNHSADIFADLIHLLRGYPLHIRNEDHRKELLKDCKYFLFKGVEQRLIPHHISYNSLRKREEIVIHLEDIRQTGLSCIFEPAPAGKESNWPAGWVNYARPHVDERPRELIVEIGKECTSINVQTMRAEFSGDGKTRISRLFEVIANKLNLPTPQPLGLLVPKGIVVSQPASPGNTALSDHQVKIVFDKTHIRLDGRKYQPSMSAELDDEMMTDEAQRSPFLADRGTSYKRKRVDSDMVETVIWTVKTGQWKLRVQSAPNSKSGVECVMVAVKLDAITDEMARNEQRPFLGT